MKQTKVALALALALTLALATPGLAQAQAQAQGTGLSFSVGAKVWSTQWTTFGYYPGVQGQPNVALTQVAAKDKIVLLPVLTVRYQDFVGAISAYPSTHHAFSDGGANTRKEIDINGGYYVLPGLALTLGYKKVSQLEIGGANRYVIAGPVIGLNATAPLNGSSSVYGALGLGKLDPTGSGNVDLKADYRLTEVGLAYSLGPQRFVKALTLTAGYRTQALTSKRALDANAQDGRDLTQGLTVGVFTNF